MLPNLPTIVESGVPNYEVLLWSGLQRRKARRKSIVDKLAEAAKKALDDPDAQKALDAQGYVPKYLGPVEFTKFYQGEVVKWGKVTPAIGALSD